MTQRKPRRKPVRLTPAERERNRKYGRRYAQRRARILAANPMCALRLPGCTGRSEETDHIIEIDRGGSSAPQNLQGVCRHCNQEKRRRRAKRLRRIGELIEQGVPAEQAQAQADSEVRVSSPPPQPKSYPPPSRDW